MLAAVSGPGDLVPEAAALRRALVGAYAAHVTGRLEALGVDATRHAGALEQGRRWLDESLAALLAQPWSAQRRSPLEVFQEAMRFPTDALEAAGVPAATRDAGQEAALPGDIYDLAPASSQALGEDAWRAHLAWGAAKARGLATSVVVYVGANLMDRTAIEQAAGATGLPVVVATTVEALAGVAGRAVRGFVDLTHSAADDAVRALAAAGVPIVAFGPHVDDFALTRARSLGADEVLPRSKFFRRLPELFPARA